MHKIKLALTIFATLTRTRMVRSGFSPSVQWISPLWPELSKPFWDPGHPCKSSNTWIKVHKMDENVTLVIQIQLKMILSLWSPLCGTKSSSSLGRMVDRKNRFSRALEMAHLGGTSYAHFCCKSIQNFQRRTSQQRFFNMTFWRKCSVKVCIFITSALTIRMSPFSHDKCSTFY